MLKKIIIITLLFISSYKIFSDELSCTYCRNKYNGSDYQHQIGYNFCDPINHKIVSLCTNGDPYNLPEPYTGWDVFKLCLPLVYGETITYSNVGVPWKNLGPWTEQVWGGQYDNTFEFRDNDIPELIKSAVNYWQNICSPYNNDGCQDCEIKILWTKDESKLGDDKLLPSHANTPLTSGSCMYDCSKLAIILNGTSGFSSVNTQGKPTHYFITRGGEEYHYGSYLVNTDLRTEIMHQLGTILGFAETTPNGDPGCGSFCSMMSEPSASGWGGTYWQVQGNRISALNSESSINPPYDFIANPIGEFCDYDECAFRLLYCCNPISDVLENKINFDNEVNIMPNPSNSRLKIQLNLRETNIVDIGIYDILNNKLMSIVTNENLPKNVYSFNADVSLLASGSYFCRYRIGYHVESKLFILIR